MVKNLGETPTQMYRQIVKVALIASSAVGADIANPNFRVNWLTNCVFFLITIYYVLTVWTVCTKIDKISDGLEAFCMAGSVVQGTTKLIGGIIRTKQYSGIRFMLEDIYKEYEKKGLQYCIILKNSCKRVKKVISFIGLGYILCAIGIFILPFTMIVINGRRYMLMQYHIPGLDINTSFGYYATLGIHATAILAAAFGLFAGDMFVLIYLIHSFMFADIFRQKVLELNEYVEDEENQKNAKVTESIKDLVNWHQKYIYFTDTCNFTFHYIITVQVTTSAVSIVLTIFVLITGDWPIGYPYLLITVYNLYVYCILGTKIEDCNADFCNEIYNISWYNLNVPQQKVIRLMLMKSQSPAIIDIAGVLPLSVSTALQISKTIYSMTMMMLQFNE